MSQNLQQRRDESVIGQIASATDEYPYLRFLPKSNREILMFMVIGDMPTIVTIDKSSSDETAMMFYHGFYKEQWYVDAMFVFNYEDESEIQNAVEKLLESAEYTLQTDLRDPAQEAQEPVDEEKTP